MGCPVFLPRMKPLDHTVGIAMIGGLVAHIVRLINEYGAALITVLTIVYLVLGIRNRWKNRKDS